MFGVQGPVPNFQPYKGSVMMDSFLLRHKHEYVILIYERNINNSDFCMVFPQSFLRVMFFLCFSVLLTQIYKIRTCMHHNNILIEKGHT